MAGVFWGHLREHFECYLVGTSRSHAEVTSWMFSKCDWWIHLGYMLRLHSKCTPNVIGGYIGGKVIQSLQFTQDVPTGFQGTSPPVCPIG